MISLTGAEATRSKWRRLTSSSITTLSVASRSPRSRLVSVDGAATSLYSSGLVSWRIRHPEYWDLVSPPTDRSERHSRTPPLLEYAGLTETVASVVGNPGVVVDPRCPNLPNANTSMNLPAAGAVEHSADLNQVGQDHIRLR